MIKGSKTLLADRKTKPNGDAMRRAAKLLGVEAPKARGGKADADLLNALREEVGKRLAQIAEDDHIKCTACGEIATDDTEFCPFCGDEGSPNEQEAVKADRQKQEAVKAERQKKVAAAAAVEDEETSWPEDMAEEGDDDEEPDDDADEDDGGDDADESDDEDESEKKPEKIEKESDDAPAESDGEEAEDDGVGIAAGGAAVTKNVPAAMKGLAGDLDKALQRIVQLKRSAVGLSYDIGLVCREIRDKQLFKARGFSSFKQFAEKELPFTRESALQLISIVEKHTREDYEQLGYAKMRVISTVPDLGVQEEMIDAARKGATTKQLKEHAISAAPPAPRKAAPAAEKGERITLLGRIGGKKQVVKFHNSETGEVINNAGILTKKSFVPSAYAELEVSEGVFLRIALRTGANQELEGLTVRFVRAE